MSAISSINSSAMNSMMTMPTASAGAAASTSQAGSSATAFSADGDTFTSSATSQQSQVGYSQSSSSMDENVVEMMVALLILELLMGQDSEDSQDPNAALMLMNALGGSEMSTQSMSSQSSMSMSSAYQTPPVSGSQIDVSI